MITIYNSKDLPKFSHSVVSVGNFDGVHLGHRELIAALLKRARSCGAVSIAITFEPHTKSIINPNSPLHLLTTVEEKEVLMRELGVDIMACLRFNRKLAEMNPGEFVDTVLSGQFRAREWVMGENHAFGRDREGTKEFLRKDHGRKHISIFPVPLNSQQTAVISSTRIRSRIVEGKIREAVRMLGHPYLILAKRIRGVQTGSSLGFPTLNFKLPPSQKVIPPPGVYAAGLTHGNNRWTGALYIGNCPTFSDRDYHIEFHALSGPDSHPDNGETALIWVDAFIRKDEIFDTPDELVVKIRQDIKQIQEIFNKE